MGVAILLSEIMQFCRVLGISNIGAKCDFEIWGGVKGFLSLDNKKQPLKWLLENTILGFLFWVKSN